MLCRLPALPALPAFPACRFGVVADFLAVALGAALTTVLATVGLRRGDALARGL